MKSASNSGEWPSKGFVALLYVLFVLLAFAALPGLWVGKSYFESGTYNRLTGAQTTTWDAMWVELRVQDSPVKGGNRE